MRFKVLFSLSALTLSACSLFPSAGEPTKKYTLGTLASESPVASSAHSRAHQLIVDLPNLYPPIDNTRIALKPQEQTIDYYADVEWADRLSALIQESVIYSLQNKTSLKGVSRPTEGIHANYALKIEVRKFFTGHPVQGQSTTAQVEYMVLLVKMPERTVVASRQFTHAQTIPENCMDAIVKSLNTAHLEVSRAMVSWVLEHVR
ncbi:MAG: ABC-type transport auxiliary lipoprotein family protein [Alphaproteobacteria bacterium]|jgi:cholesterol transport system auxiliary component|nr:ABC-type transport auxiliary lipoprotein family protein [Alphaproteobacteria bacterium]